MATGFFRQAYRGLHRFWNKSVRRQLVLGIALVHATLMTGFVLDLVSRQKAFLHEESIKQATSLAETLAANSVSWMLSDDLIGMEETVESLKNAPGLEYAMILDDQCRVLAHTEQERVGMYLKDRISLGLLDGSQTPRFLVVNRNLIDIAAPVLVNGKRIGWARVSLSQSAQRVNLALVTRNGLIYTIVAILIGTVMAVFISKGLTLGLAKLVSLSAQVQAGAREVRADEQRIDEIGALARGFNRMLVSIEDSEKSLRDSLNWKKTILDTSAAGILVVSGNKVIKEANARLCSMFGYKPEELIGKSVEVLHVSHESFMAFVNDAYSLTTQQEIVDVEYPLIKKDGLPLWCNISGRAIAAAEGDKGVIWVLADITERKLAEEELRNHREHLEDLVAQRTRELELEVAERQLAQEGMRRAKEAAEAASLAKSVFLANMSHELRTPLNSVLGFAQILRRDAALNEAQKENLDIILRSGEHLLGLINDVLEISKIEAGRSKPTNAPFDLWGVLDAVVEMMGVRAREKGLQLLLERDPGLPRYISADQRKLKQVILNLVGNAVKFTEEGRVVLRARPGAGSDILEFEAQDTGPGIPASIATNLFQRFGQGENGKEGIGLGLYISKKLVEIMGGEISVKSEPGKGSLFTFDIRCALACAPEAQAQTVSPWVVRLAPGQPAYRILVAEDKEDNRLLLVKILRFAGFDVDEARNGAEAVKLFEENPPNLALMDLRMPVMDGYEAIRRIKASEKGAAVPIIAVTASAFEEDRQKVLATGAADFLRKPVPPSVLFHAIRRWLGVAYLEVEEPARKTDLPGKAEAGRLAADLPEELLKKLNAALDELDLSAFTALLQEVSGQDQRLADGLRRLAQKYEISILQEILKPGRQA